MHTFYIGYTVGCYRIRISTYRF